ncbi:MAG: TonB-dependent receptor [Pseudomonadales bacterium]|jgi:outer membrane receptor protein involved in Fe transport|nr:TonB-dependent receptor [Pseudomonadales bacterium]
MSEHKIKQNLLAAAIALLGGTAHSALAQNAAPAQQLEEIQITGSRLQRPGITSPVPVTAVSSEELTFIAPGNLSQGLQQLPQFLNNATAQNRGTFLGSAGQAFLNIRGMGAQRTLVLLNGRRVAPSDRQSSVDVNLFPDAMISRVDVVTGGASAAYGADALAGVANFVVNTDYQGFQVSVQKGETEYHDGKNWEASLSGGFDLGDKAHVIASLEAYHNDDIRGYRAGLDERDWFERWGWVNNPAWSASDPPGTQPQRLTLPEVHSSAFTPGGKINQPGFRYNNYTFIEDGTQLRLFVPGAINGGGATSGGPEYAIANLGQRENLQSEVNRKNLFFNIDYPLNERTTFNFQAIAGKNAAYGHKLNGGLGPSMMGIWAGTIYVDNAFLPETVRQAMLEQGLTSFRMEKGGALPGRNNFQDDYTDGTEVSQTMFLLGVDHHLNNGWDVNAYYQRGKSHKHMLLDNLLRVDRWFLAQDAVRDPQSGKIVCRVQLFNPTPQQLAESVQGVLVPSPQGPVPIASPVGLDNSIADCQPLNIFGWGNVSQAAQDYVVSDKWAESYVTQDFAEAVLSGDVFNARSTGPISFSLGATWRKEYLEQTAYPREIDALGPPLNRPALGIQGIPGGYTGGSPNLHAFSNLTTFGGQFDVWEVFGETLVPLLNKGTQRLDLNLAARHSDYSLAGGVLTWKAGLDFQVTQALRLRTTYSRDVREATFAERFDKAGGGTTVNDPLFNGQPFNITTASGGNPDVKPEQAATYVVGFVYQPRWLPGLDVSADYYDIDLSGAIGSIGFQRVVDDCAAGNQALCAQIDRDPASNQITRVEDFFTNIDAARTRGVDMEVAYRTEINLFPEQQENLTLRLLASYLAENSNTPSGGRKTDFAGAGLTPKWTSTATLNYDIGPWRVFLSHRFIDKSKFNVNWVEGVDVDNNYLEAVSWVNLRVGYTGRLDDGATWEVYGNITNLFGADPPPNPGTVGRGLPGGANAMHQTLALGRSYVLGLSLRF